MSIRAAIDLGTNTCLLLIAEWDEKTRRVTKILRDEVRFVRLGQGVDENRSLHPEAMKRTLETLSLYREYVKSFGLEPSQTTCVATSQARDASNGLDFFKRVEKEAGFSFRVISGDDEARFTFLGALLPGMIPQATAVMDIGGGSTELVSYNGGQSLDIGSVRFTERYLKSDPVTDEEFWKAQEAVDAALETLIPWRKTLDQNTQLLGVAGTIINVGAWHLGLTDFDRPAIEKGVVHRGDVHRLVEELKWRTVEERRQMLGIEIERADVILAGVLILWRAMEILSFSELRISTRGLRFGVIDANF